MLKITEIILRQSLMKEWACSSSGMTIPKDRTELFGENYSPEPHIHQIPHMQRRYLKIEHL
jgi:hypothetical protein